MDRAETTGLGVAVAGHVALLAALTLGFANSRLPLVQNDPIEVSFVDETGLESVAPTSSDVPPAPRLAELEGPVEPTAPPPEPLPAPSPRPAAAEPSPAPAPKPVPRPRPTKAAAAAPAKAAPPRDTRLRPTGRLDKGLLAGLSDRESDSRATAPAAKAAGPAVQRSLQAEVLRQLKPYWKAPTGADAEQLRTELSITLARNGTVTDIDILRTTGVTPSNRPQVKLHQEQAIRAARLASPFKLPAEYYDVWKLLSPIGFDKRLSQ